MSVEQNKQIVRRAFEAFEGGDLGPLRDLLAPDAVIHQCGFLEPIPGHAITQGEFPVGLRIQDREFQLERVIGEGDIVALHWRTAGRWSEPDSSELDGTPIRFPSMSFIRIENGRIAEIWNIQDRSTLETQLWEARERAGSR